MQAQRVHAGAATTPRCTSTTDSHWCTLGPLALWPFGPLALWPFGPLALWPFAHWLWQAAARLMSSRTHILRMQWQRRGRCFADFLADRFFHRPFSFFFADTKTADLETLRRNRTDIALLGEPGLHGPREHHEVEPYTCAARHCLARAFAQALRGATARRPARAGPSSSIQRRRRGRR